MSHTYAVLDVPKSAYDAIKALLRDAGYDHAFHDDVIDMHGIALRSEPGSGSGMTDLQRARAYFQYTEAVKAMQSAIAALDTVSRP